jgi:hypothetical protein
LMDRDLAVTPCRWHEDVTRRGGWGPRSVGCAGTWSGSGISRRRSCRRMWGANRFWSGSTGWWTGVPSRRCAGTSMRRRRGDRAIR